VTSYRLLYFRWTDNHIESNITLGAALKRPKTVIIWKSRGACPSPPQLAKLWPHHCGLFLCGEVYE